MLGPGDSRRFRGHSRQNRSQTFTASHDPRKAQKPWYLGCFCFFSQLVVWGYSYQYKHRGKKCVTVDVAIFSAFWSSHLLGVSCWVMIRQKLGHKQKRHKLGRVSIGFQAILRVNNFDLQPSSSSTIMSCWVSGGSHDHRYTSASAPGEFVRSQSSGRKWGVTSDPWMNKNRWQNNNRNKQIQQKGSVLPPVWGGVYHVLLEV